MNIPTQATRQRSQDSTITHTAQLLRILELERSKDFDDRAVIGGLDRFLQHWVAAAQQTLADPHLQQKFKELFTHVTYAAWDKIQRQKWAEKTLSWLEKNETGLP